MMDLFKLVALAMSVTFMTQLLKKVGRDTEATFVSIVGLIIGLMIVLEHVKVFFEAVETMLFF